MRHPDTHRLVRSLISRTTPDATHGLSWGPDRTEDYLREVHAWLRSLDYYDESGIEAVATLPELARFGVGDCDDTAVAAYVLAQAVGLRPGLAWAHRPGYRHVWTVETTTGLGLDPAVPWGHAGGDPRQELMRRGWKL